MEYGEIFERVRGILCENFGVDESEITLKTDLFKDLDADSLDLVDLISSIECEFGVETDDETVGEIKVVDDVVQCVKRLKDL